MRHALYILILIWLAVAGVSAEPELRGTPAELTAYLAGLPKMVSVTGESEVKLPADRAVITLKISTESKSLQEALRLNQEMRGRVLGIEFEHSNKEALKSRALAQACDNAAERKKAFEDKLDFLEFVSFN